MPDVQTERGKKVDRQVPDWFMKERCEPCTDRVGHTRPMCDEPCYSVREEWEEYQEEEADQEVDDDLIKAGQKLCLLLRTVEDALIAANMVVKDMDVGGAVLRASLVILKNCMNCVNELGERSD